MAHRFDLEVLMIAATRLDALATEVQQCRGRATDALGAVGRWSRSVAALPPEAIAARSRQLRVGVSRLRHEEQTAADALRLVWQRIVGFAGSDNDPLLDRWLAESRVLESELITWLIEATPRAVAVATADLPDALGRRLVLAAPEVVSSTDGLPVTWRADATRRLMERERARLRRVRDGFGMWLGDLMAWPGESERDRLDARIELLDGWLASERMFVAFEPGGDGRVVELFGDVETADHLAVVVPGIGSTLDNFDAWVSAPARRLHETSGVAVAAWLGYDAPLGPGLNVDAATRDNARDGAPSLRGFVDGLSVRNPGAGLTVVAHSYGTVVTGWAARDDVLAADRLILVGSPNVPVASVQGLRLNDHGTVYVGEAPGDPVVWLGDVSDGWFPVLGHGWDPGDCEEFGAWVFATDATSVWSAHSSYLAEGSGTLETIADLVVGATDEVDFVCGPDG